MQSDFSLAFLVGPPFPDGWIGDAGWFYSVGKPSIDEVGGRFDTDITIGSLGMAVRFSPSLGGF